MLETSIGKKDTSNVNKSIVPPVLPTDSKQRATFLSLLFSDFPILERQLDLQTQLFLEIILIKKDLKNKFTDSCGTK